MNFAKSFYSSFILVLIFSTLLAIAGIKGFTRLAPSIDKINKHNTQSLFYAEQMMSALTVKKDKTLFVKTLNLEKKNITETGESEAYKSIEDNYTKAFSNDFNAKETTTNSIIELSKVNRIAMQEATLHAKKLSSAGAWVIVFITIMTWSLGLILMKTLTTNLIKPLRELIDVLETSKTNKLRRCPKIAPNKDFQKIYDAINKILDKQNYWD